MIDWPTTNGMRAAGEEVRFSCIYKSARKQIVKSALRINVASGLRANKHQCRGFRRFQSGRFGKVVRRGADRGSMIFTGRPWHPREVDPDALQYVIEVKEGRGRRVAAAGSREDAHIGSVDVLAITQCEGGRKILCRGT
jgi:hypothetical protein